LYATGHAVCNALLLAECVPLVPSAAVRGRCSYESALIQRRQVQRRGQESNVSRDQPAQDEAMSRDTPVASQARKARRHVPKKATGPASAHRRHSIQPADARLAFQIDHLNHRHWYPVRFEACRRGLNSLTVHSCAFGQGLYGLNVQEMQTGEA
jgi:hypothetical protein